MKLILGIVLIVLTPVSFAASKAVAPYHLSDVIRELQLSGLQFDSPGDKEATQKETDSYIEQRSNEAPVRERKKMLRIARERRRSVTRLILNGMSSHNFSGLKEMSGQDLLRGMKFSKSMNKTESVSLSLLKKTDCAPSSLYTALGLAIEKGFPQDKYIALAKKLYQKSSECGQDSPAMEAQYRLGLLEILEGNYQQAEQILTRIPDAPAATDFRLRTAYWKFYCATKLAKVDEKEKLKAWLMKEYPFSFHQLAARVEKDLNLQPSLSREDPEVRFRSVQDPSLNSVTRIVETLLERNEQEFASDLLEKNMTRVLTAELSFQLYWVVLCKRAKAESGSYNLLAFYLKSNPVLSKTAVELLFPVAHFELVKKVAANDPYLILALIRQESAFDSSARSSAGAYGLMQLQVPTARLFKRVSKKQLYDPEVNIQVGTKYLKWLIKRYNGQVGLALAAYNAGPNRVKEWEKRYRTENRLLFFDLIPIRETREYVSSIIRSYYWYTQLYQESKEGQDFSQKGQILQILGCSPENC